MSTKKGTIEYLIDQLGALKGVRSRAMFGEYALYYQDKVVALVCDDELFVKITPAGQKFVGDKYEEGSPYPGAKPWMHISADLLEDRDFSSKLISITADALPKPQPKKRKSK